MTPEQINELINGVVMPPPVAPGIHYRSPEYRKWEDDVQTYYDRVGELRRQLHDAVPGRMPYWVKATAYWAWQGAANDATTWRHGRRSSRRETDPTTTIEPEGERHGQH